VFIFDDCDTLPADTWSVISKVVDRAPRRVVFILISPSLELPHIILSRCQKFFFPKLRECDIVNTLQWICTSESLDVDKDALKLIASRSDGSLRDAEMTLDQLSLLGQRISLSLVQELVRYLRSIRMSSMFFSNINMKFSMAENKFLESFGQDLDNFERC
jgi:DNA polymerase III gamma/tau subunit